MRQVSKLSTFLSRLRWGGVGRRRLRWRRAEDVRRLGRRRRRWRLEAGGIGGGARVAWRMPSYRQRTPEYRPSGPEGRQWVAGGERDAAAGETLIASPLPSQNHSGGAILFFSDGIAGKYSHLA